MRQNSTKVHCQGNSTCGSGVGRVVEQRIIVSAWYIVRGVHIVPPLSGLIRTSTTCVVQVSGSCSCPPDGCASCTRTRTGNMYPMVIPRPTKGRDAKEKR